MVKAIRPQFLTCIAALPVLASTRPMAQGDPNLDPSWEWQSEDMVALYSSTTGKEVGEHKARLPFFSSGNPLRTFKNPDFLPEDGWVLVHRDFGTAGSAPVFPYFTLYNKYRGIFRVMLFNAEQREGSYLLGELAFLDGAKFLEARAGLMTMADVRPENGVLDSYDPTFKMSAVSKMTAYQSWAVFDFPMVGFEPELGKRDPVLSFRLTSIEKKELALKTDGDIQLMQTFENGPDVQPGQSTFETMKSAASKGYATYKTVSGFIENEIQSEAAMKKHGTQDWYKAVKALSDSKVGSFIPYVAAMGSVLEFFVGGANSASAWEPLKFMGQLHLNTSGTLTSSRDLWANDFFVRPGKTQEHLAQRPLRQVPWGICNLVTLPKVDVAKVTPYVRNNWNGCDVTVILLQEPKIVVNPDCGMELVATRVAFTVEDRKNGGRQASSFMSLPDAMSKGHTFDKRTEHIEHDGLLWEFRFKVVQPTKHSDSEVVVVKKTGFVNKSEEDCKERFRLMREEACRKKGLPPGSMVYIPSPCTLM